MEISFQEITSLCRTLSAAMFCKEVVMANTLTRYQPTGATRLPDVIDRLFQESFVLPSMFDRTFGGSAKPSLPVNLIETADSYVIQASLPVLNTDNLDIQVVGR